MTDSINQPATTAAAESSHALVTYEGDGDSLSALDGAIGDGGGLAGTRLVWVTPERTPDEMVRHLESGDVSGMPRSVDLLSIGDRVRAATATADTPSTTVVPFEGAELTVHGLRRGSDVDEIARSVLDCVEHVARGDQEIFVDNVARLVTQTSLEEVFRLLHLLIAKATVEGWSVTAGLDAARVSEETARTLEPLFDEVY
jgi:hypothetical protein